MRLVIAGVGRLKRGPEYELVTRFGERIGALSRQSGLGPLTISEVAGSSPDEEAASLLAKIPQDATVIAMEEGGVSRASEGFARHLADLRDRGVRDLVFALGGADGHGGALRERADSTMSLGRLTLPHMLARVVLTEQLYRAATILVGHPYHRE